MDLATEAATRWTWARGAETIVRRLDEIGECERDAKLPAIRNHSVPRASIRTERTIG